MKRIKKLVLHKETVRALEQDELKDVKGTGIKQKSPGLQEVKPDPEPKKDR